MKILITLCLIAGLSYAGGFRHHGAPSWRSASNHHTVHHGTWVIPLALGGIIGYVVGNADDPEDKYKPAPVYNVYLDEKRKPSYVVTEDYVYFEECDCYKKVLIKE